MTASDVTTRCGLGFARPLAPDELRLIDAYWRAANYLSVGQIYLLDNPLLREPLAPEHVKPRLLGHWGTTPGLNLIYAHMNRVIRNWDLDAIYVIGPGHGGPAIVANAYLEGTYSEVYPSITRDEDGHPQAVPPVLVPGRHPQPRRARDAGLHPRGRRARLRALARLRRGVRQPGPARLRGRRRRRGRDRARSRPAGTRTSSSTRSRDGAVLPILHLNGYKIANPTVLARIPKDGAGGADGGLRPQAVLRRGRRPGRRPPAAGGHDGRRDRGDPRGSRRRPARAASRSARAGR